MTTATGCKARIELLRTEIAKLEAAIATHQLQFQTAREREQAERILAELLRMTADLMSAREATVRLEQELAALRSMRAARPWWWPKLTG